MIQIINTGVANIRSLQAAFDRLGQSWNLTEKVDDIKNANHVVLPGVGAFAAAADSIDRLGLREAVKQRLEDPSKSTLCICLGMQLLYTSSEEAESSIGLGVIPRTIKRFDDDVPVPQLGWNAVVPSEIETAPYVSGEAYFANSFRLTETPPDDWGYAQTEYGGTFVSSVWRGKTLACQFHPELSGDWGQQVLSNWIAGNVNQGASAC
jgi:imidazole glycerol phosphate synthase glutamine amidotransferase subunit